MSNFQVKHTRLCDKKSAGAAVHIGADKLPQGSNILDPYGFLRHGVVGRKIFRPYGIPIHAILTLQKKHEKKRDFLVVFNVCICLFLMFLQKKC